MPKSIRERLADFLIGDVVNKRVALAVRALDDPRDRRYGDNPRDRYVYDREEILRDVLEAWRVNPLARRIVELTSQYVVGSGLGVDCDHPASHEFLQSWWFHRLNNLSIRAFDWCDELTRAGELFIILSTDAAGMSYLRAVPALEIEKIESASNDLEQETGYLQKSAVIGEDSKLWPAYNEQTDDGKSPVMLHYAINRPVGGQRGESDLAPLLRWLTRYSGWLEDRARLNKYRQAFVYVVHGHFANEAERVERQQSLNANPPNPGSILVLNEGETWEVIEPKLASNEAGEDGQAIKKMVAAGAGIPMHFLAEPEGSTRTTAAESGGPTFRHYDQRQQFFLWVLSDLARIALRRRAHVDGRVSATAAVKVHGTDISSRDNAALASSAESIVRAFIQMRAHGLIDDAELLRLAYRFAGEVVDVQKILENAKEVEKWQITPAVAQSSGANGSAAAA